MKRLAARGLELAAIVLTAIVPASAQFSSGSTGADGALSFTTPGTVDFDPTALGINAAGDNIFNFTTINIATGVTVRLRSTRVRQKPVVWLASGAVTIAGTIDLSGADGAIMSAANPSQTRVPAEPGAGGYSGGLGNNGASPASNGFGPGGGEVGSGGSFPTPYAGGGGGFATPGVGNAVGGKVYGSVSLTPLVGGSGGGGASYAGCICGNGGAGGGALRIVSSVSIAVTGAILAKGGAGNLGPNNTGVAGGSGSGGAIHLVAPGISGAGTLDASGGAANTDSNNGGLGRILLNSNAVSFTGTSNPTVNVARLYLPPNPAGVPAVHVTSINGVAAPQNPTGDRLFPDVIISSASAVTVAIAAMNIPVGTVVSLFLNPENASDQSIACTPLSGTVANSTATCTASFPSGITITAARAIW
jgi:hypothetical protein